MAKTVKPRDSGKFEKAFQLFIGGINQKDICSTLDISDKTLKRWIDDGLWKDKRATKVVSLDAMINRLMNISSDMLEREDFVENLSENSNAIAKLLRQIKSLKNGTTINDRVQTFSDFIDWMFANAGRDKDLTTDIVRKIVDLQDKYIKQLRNETNN